MSTQEVDRRYELDRFEDPLYTAAEAARYLGMPPSTFSRWSRGYHSRHPGGPDTVGKPVITALEKSGVRGPVIPFVGLAEGYTLSAIRKSGVPLQRIRPALSRLQEEVGIGHALASRRLFTDGVEVLFDYADAAGDQDTGDAVRELVVVRHGQRVFNEVVEASLQRIEFGPDGYAQVVPLLGYETAELVVDTTRGFGQPVFHRGGARLEDVLSLFYAGESMAVVAEEYGVPLAELEDAVRVAARPAA